MKRIYQRGWLLACLLIAAAAFNVITLRHHRSQGPVAASNLPIPAPLYLTQRLVFTEDGEVLAWFDHQVILAAGATLPQELAWTGNGTEVRYSGVRFDGEALHIAGVDYTYRERFQRARNDFMEIGPGSWEGGIQLRVDGEPYVSPCSFFDARGAGGHYSAAAHLYVLSSHPRLTPPAPSLFDVPPPMNPGQAAQHMKPKHGPSAYDIAL